MSSLQISNTRCLCSVPSGALELKALGFGREPSFQVDDVCPDSSRSAMVKLAQTRRDFQPGRSRPLRTFRYERRGAPAIHTGCVQVPELVESVVRGVPWDAARWGARRGCARRLPPRSDNGEPDGPRSNPTVGLVQKRPIWSGPGSQAATVASKLFWVRSARSAAAAGSSHRLVSSCGSRSRSYSSPWAGPPW